MRRIFFYQAALWVICLFTACSEVANEMAYPSIGSSTGTEGESENRIKAMVTLSESNRLDAQLEATLGADKKYLIQDLTISGTFYGVDVETLHKLTQLESVDMSNAVLSGANQSHYEFPLDSNGNYSSGDLSDNCLSRNFFYRMNSLKQIVLPSTITQMGYCSMAGTSIQEIQIPSTVTTMGGCVFESCDQLRFLRIPSTVTSVAYGWNTFLTGCDRLTNLVWETSADIGFQRPNNICVLHLVGDGANASIIITGSRVEWPCVARDGQVDSLSLTHSDVSWETILCYSNRYRYKAKKASLKMLFSQIETSVNGTPCGWRTIVVPFDVDKVISKKRGLLAPFGCNVEGAKPFWLRELTPDGFVNATSIKANIPYIMALPNNPNYSEEYNIDGLITFTAEDATIAVTPNPLPAVEGPNYDLQPTYEYVPHSRDVFALNYNYDIRNVPYGSVFANMSADIYPFEAYAKPKSGSSLTEVASAFAIGSSTSTRTVKTNGVKRAPLPDDM